MHSFIAFRLYGPLAAWGDIAVGEQRPTTPHPSKSAVLGLVAAALGIRRDDDAAHAALRDGYGYAVRADALGSPLRDYHTSQFAKSTSRLKHLRTRRDELADRHNLGTVLSFRDYRTDAVHTACLHARSAPDAPTPQALVGALKHPRFPLYLGRRSCPLALPLNPYLIEADDLAAALRAYDEAHPLDQWAILTTQLDLRAPEDAPCWWEDGLPTGSLSPSATTPRYDQPGSRARRHFSARTEHYRAGGQG